MTAGTHRPIAVAAVLAALASCARAPEPAAPARIYVSNERGNTVVAIEPATGAVVQRIAAGLRPRGLALSPDGRHLFVAVSGSPIGGPNVDESRPPPADHRADGIAMIDLATGRVERVLKAGCDPETFALSPDGRMLYVSNEDSGAVSAVSVDGVRAPQVAPVGEEPEGIAVTPDGARLFVACEASDHVAVLDARTLRRLDTIPIAGRPRGALMASDGAHVYISVENAGKLAVIAVATGRIERLIDLAGAGKGLRPMGMAEGRDGHLFVTTGRAGSVLEVDPAAGAIVRRIARVGARPWGIAATGGGRALATANGPSDNVSIIDVRSGRVIRTVHTGEGPWGVAARTTN